MNSEDRQHHIQGLLVARGWDTNQAREAASEAIESGEPLLETLCFQALAEHVLAAIHDASWIANRADDPDIEHHELIKRLLDAGACAEDLAVFARMMQRQYLSDLGCILDGAGIYGTPGLPFEDFRVFAVDDDNKPIALIDELHEQLGFLDLDTEMRLSRQAAGEDDKGG